ncbi:MAG: phosphatidylglycerophosphatase A [Elusimicrobia bacterium HGW-Elusimicrobia-2]|nr:MAG: phosphatidylglycerophosphatase A [Elusimicrobia bacterium HGW-Elusimicrobia-2]
MMNKVIKFLATGFGVSRFAPHPGEGTIGTLVGVVIFVLWPDSRLYPNGFWLLLILGLTLGVYVAGKAEEIFAQKDCPRIVIDEIMGFLIAAAFLPKTFWMIFSAFILFRIFDGLKPGPVRFAEKFSGGWGIMGDDIVAGIFANIIMQIVVFRFF